MKCEVGLTSPMGQFDLTGACRNCAIACYGLLASRKLEAGYGAMPLRLF